MEKKKDIYEGLPVDKLTVQKSKPLLRMWQSNFTLDEFKLLDAYLGRIDSQDEEHRTVVFSKGEFERLLGVKELKPNVLKAKLSRLMRTITIPGENGGDDFSEISLFEIAICKKDKETGLWMISLTCTPSAKKYIFNLPSYLQYKLRCVVKMKSRYTYIMFLYLLDNKYRGTWEISLDELKEMLGCGSQESYKKFKVFHDQVLKKAQKEIEDVTDLRYEYTTIKRGRKVIAIKFKSVHTELPSEIPQSEYEGKVALPTVKDKEGWEDVLAGEKWSASQMTELREILITIPDGKLPQLPPDTDTDHDELDIRRYHYVRQKYATLNTYAERKRIRNRFSYFKKLLQNDIMSRVADTDNKSVENKLVRESKNAFHNFEERQDINYDDIQAKLAQKRMAKWIEK